MGETYKEIAKRATCIVEGQINGNIENVDANELGEVVDIIKDMEEAAMYCEQAKYYKKITEAMEKNSKEENEYYMEKYSPETMATRYYTRPRMMRPIRYYEDDKMWYPESDPEYKRDMDMIRNRMYYTNTQTTGNEMNHGNRNDMYGNSNGMMHDPREGRSYMGRRRYMETRENGADAATKKQELEKYMEELSTDMTEIISGMDANEKQVLKQKLTSLANRV